MCLIQWQVMTWRSDLALYCSTTPDLWIVIHHWSEMLVFQNSMFCFGLKKKCRIYKPSFLLQLASDIVYLLCVNGLGLYFRLMSEVTIRRTFLDRRACLESNSKLEYERTQEVSCFRIIRQIIGIDTEEP